VFRNFVGQDNKPARSGAANDVMAVFNSQNFTITSRSQF